jgi:hypothetical protein
MSPAVLTTAISSPVTVTAGEGVGRATIERQEFALLATV